MSFEIWHQLVDLSPPLSYWSIDYSFASSGIPHWFLVAFSSFPTFYTEVLAAFSLQAFNTNSLIPFSLFWYVTLIFFVDLFLQTFLTDRLIAVSLFLVSTLICVSSLGYSEIPHWLVAAVSSLWIFQAYFCFSFVCSFTDRHTDRQTDSFVPLGLH